MTSTQTERAKAKLATLSASFDELEALVEPLFGQTLPETLVGLEPIQQAKLQTLMPYLVYDLVFIYLKSRGVDPKTHPVVAELDRVKQYFNKINNAENPPQKRAELDKDVAQRFIKHAIANLPKPPPTQEEPPQPSTFVEPKVTSKMLARQQYEKELKEQDAQPDNEESDLEMYGEDSNEDLERPSQTGKDVKGKGKAVEQNPEGETTAPTKRRRAAIDHFAGYGDEPPSSAAAQPSVEKKVESKPQPKKRKKAAEDSTPATPSAPTPSQSNSGSPTPAETKTRKKGKKQKK